MREVPKRAKESEGVAHMQFIAYCVCVTSFCEESLKDFKTEFMRGPGRCDISHLSDFNETWSN